MALNSKKIYRSLLELFLDYDSQCSYRFSGPEAAAQHLRLDSDLYVPHVLYDNVPCRKSTKRSAGEQAESHIWKVSFT